MTFKLKVAIVAYACIAVFVALPLNTAIFYRESEALWRGDRECGATWWREHRRRAFGRDLVVGALYSMTWPFGIPLAYAWTGFAEHGIVNYRGPVGGDCGRPEPSEQS